MTEQQVKEIQAVLNMVVQQRNQALDTVAALSARIQVLSEELAKEREEKKEAEVL